MVKPDSNGSPLLPKRSGPKTLVPSSWLDRTVLVEYINASGKATKIDATLIELYPFGPCIAARNGEKQLISWDRLVEIHLRREVY